MLDGEYDAVFLGTGAGVGNELGIEGEDLEGVHRATDYLVRGNLLPHQLPEHLQEPLPQPTKVAVIGGGDTSMDCVRTAVRMGAETVTCVYRRTEAEMLGRGEERINAREEGVQFEMLTAPLRILGDENGKATGVECIRMRLGEPDDSGRRRPVPIEGSEFVHRSRHHPHRHRLRRRPRRPRHHQRAQHQLGRPHRDRRRRTHLPPRRLRRRRQRQRRRPRRHRPRRRPRRRRSHRRLPGHAGLAALPAPLSRPQGGAPLSAVPTARSPHPSARQRRALSSKVERAKGIEPSSQPWEGRILPLNHARPRRPHPIIARTSTGGCPCPSPKSSPSLPTRSTRS